VLLAEAARRGALKIEEWTLPPNTPNTDPRLRVVGPAEAVLWPVVVLGDGAHWIWDLAAEHFGPEWTEIVDYYHATEHVWTVARALYGDSSEHTDTWAEAWCVDLLGHGPQPFLTALRTLEPPSLTSDTAKVVRTEMGYFSTNAACMDYPTFRAQGLPIGSGAAESVAKHVVQVRVKRSGIAGPTRAAKRCWPCAPTAAATAVYPPLPGSPVTLETQQSSGRPRHLDPEGGSVRLWRTRPTRVYADSQPGGDRL
jgi:hypothetical protein